MTLRSCSAVVALAAAALLTVPSADAVETWAVEGGRTTVHLNTEVLRDLGLELGSVNETALRPALSEVQLEPPYMTFGIGAAPAEFRVNHGLVLTAEESLGRLSHDGGFVITDAKSGVSADFDGFRIDQLADGSFFMSDASGETSFELKHGALRLEGNTLASSFLELEVSADWARRAGRPELAGAILGLVYVEGNARHVAGESTGTPPAQASEGGGIRDVKLGILDSIRRSGRVGSYPNGTVGVSMATTSCNVGTENVQWYAPMSEDHPSIAMHLYRELDGKFEQIGTSWLKHGFFALSNSQCTPCQNPSGGDFLGVGCSDTYGAGNNENRRWLGPRDEWDPYAGTWECTGSFFADYQPDCVRRNDGGGYNGYEHRLEVEDSELNNAGATYWYEAYYIVRDDDNKFNNWGSRECTMSWSGSQWNFSTPGGGNPLVEGPALYRWGDMHTVASPGPNDGDFLVAVKVTDKGGSWLYDYNVLNMDSDREIHTFSVPLSGAIVPRGTGASAINPEFNDWDSDPGNDWNVNITGGEITWSTDDFATDPNANALVFGYMFSFRFESDTPPSQSAVYMDMFKPGPDDDYMIADMMAPGFIVATGEATTPPTPARLLAARPNPASRGTSIPFVLERESNVDVSIFDASGRRVTSLVDRRISVGSHDVDWDTTDDAGHRVAAGVYYVRLRVDNQLVSSRSVVVVE